VLKGIHLDVDPGEVVVVFGRSGSGKSTLLRCINFLEEPSEGTIEVAGIRIDGGGHRTRAKRERIRQLRIRTGMVFQDFNLFPHLTALENVIEGPMTVLGRPRREAENAGRELLHMVGLAEKAGHHPIQLSGGEQQRTAIARALVHEPRLVIADEPTGNLDPLISWEIIQLLLRINELGVTVLMATHDADVVTALRKRVVALEEGRVIRDEIGGGYHRRG